MNSSVAISIPWLKKSKANSGRVGLTVGPDGLSVACVDAARRLVFCQFFDTPEDSQALLNELVAEQSWGGMPCSLVLHPVYYQLLLTETPAVNADEMSSAIRWKIKELLDFPLEDAAIEYFELPADAFRGRRKMLYAATLRKGTLKELLQPVAQSGLAVDCIEVAELALHNLTANIPVERGGVAILQLLQGVGFINLVEDGAVYLCRRLDFGLDRFDALGDNSAFFDSLMLEIQRSLDYYESQLGKGIVTNLYYAPGIIMTEPIGEFLSQSLAITVEPLTFAKMTIDTELELEDPQLLRSVNAIGAALTPQGLSEVVDAAD